MSVTAPVSDLVQRSSVPEQVFQALLSAIVEDRYTAGDRLPSQRALAAELGVNLASLREGIKRLEQLRLIEVRHGEPMRVLDWRTSASIDVLTHAAAGRRGLTEPLFEARRLLLRESARLAATRRTDDQADTLSGLATSFAHALDDASAQLLDLAFMTALIDAADNLVFALILNSVRDLYAAHAEHYRPIVADRDELAPLYARAAEAIDARRADTAADAVEALAALQERRILAGRGHC